MAFKDLSEVNLFLWNWIWNFGTAVFSYLLVGTRNGLFNVYSASASLTNQIFTAQKPWYNQVIKFLTASWRDTGKKTTSATKSALGKLGGIKQSVTEPHISVTDRILRAGADIVELLSAPLRTAVGSFIDRIKDLRPISNTISSATEGEIYAAETRSEGAFHEIAARTDELAAWVNGVLDEDGLFQPGRFLTSIAAYATSVMAVFVNGGVPVDPGPVFESLTGAHPIRTVAELDIEIASGELPYRPEITEALELFT